MISEQSVTKKLDQYNLTYGTPFTHYSYQPSVTGLTIPSMPTISMWKLLFKMITLLIVRLEMH